MTENKTPGKAPAGYAFLDPVSYIVALKEGVAGAKVQSIDYEFDIKSASPLLLPPPRFLCPNRPDCSHKAPQKQLLTLRTDTAVAKLGAALKTSVKTGKLDATTKTFVFPTAGKADFDDADHESKFAVTDMTGEWAVFVAAAGAAAAPKPAAAVPR